MLEIILVLFHKDNLAVKAEELASDFFEGIFLNNLDKSFNLSAFYTAIQNLRVALMFCLQESSI